MLKKVFYFLISDLYIKRTCKYENFSVQIFLLQDENRSLVERLIKYKAKDADKMNEENEHFLK